MSFGSIISSLADFGKGLVKKAPDWIAKNPDAVLAGAGLIQGAVQGHGASQLQNDALGQAQARYAERAPLRAMALRQLLATEAMPGAQGGPSGPRDLGALYRDPQNPFTRAVR